MTFPVRYKTQPRVACTAITSLDAIEASARRYRTRLYTKRYEYSQCRC